MRLALGLECRLNDLSCAVQAPAKKVLVGMKTVREGEKARRLERDESLCRYRKQLAGTLAVGKNARLDRTVEQGAAAAQRIGQLVAAANPEFTIGVPTVAFAQTGQRRDARQGVCAEEVGVTAGVQR